MELTDLWKALLIGFAAGAMSGAFGIGGGVLATPMTRYILGLSAHAAIGTTLAMIIPTAVVGSINYFRQNLVSTSLAKTCAPAAVLGTLIGSTLSTVLNGHALMILVLVFIAVTGIDFLTGFSEKLKKEQASNESQQLTAAAAPHWTRKALALGLLTGLLSGLLGVGGGFILVPGFCYFFHMSIKAAFGTSLLVVAAVAIPGTIAHALANHVNISVALTMICGAIPGAWLGSAVALRVKDSWLKLAFGSSLLLMAIVFLIREISALTQ